MKPVLYAFLIFFIIGCKKDKTNTGKCDSNAATERIILNKKATVYLEDNGFVIIEENSIDGKLKPCNLSKEFQVNKLNVTVSGEVKQAANISGPCCTNVFIISKIVF